LESKIVPVIAIFSPKGGAGKTTLCVHLSVAAIGTGLNVCILDCDPQASAVAWRNQRLNESPVVVPVPGSFLPQAIAGAVADGYDLIIIDSPPSVSAVTAQIIGVADLIVVPVRPEPLDLAAMPDALKLIGGKPFVFLLSDCPQKAPEISATRIALEATGHPVVGQVNNWRSMWRALVSGQAVAEFEPDGKPAKEVAEVCTNILSYLATGHAAVETSIEACGVEHVS
jgi:chromosome partitioning protein